MQLIGWNGCDKIDEGLLTRNEKLEEIICLLKRIRGMDSQISL